MFDSKGARVEPAKPKFEIKLHTAKVVDLATLEEVSRPDVAAVAVSNVIEAADKAGGKVTGTVQLAGGAKLRVVRDEDTE